LISKNPPTQVSDHFRTLRDVEWEAGEDGGRPEAVPAPET